jgi:IclR family acetate operon transcriptional repressor
VHPVGKWYTDNHRYRVDGTFGKGTVKASAATRGTRDKPPTKATGSANEPDALSVRALARGLSILGLFDFDHRTWTIDEIAEKTGLLRMTAYRMVRTLEAAGFLVRDRVTNHYHIGPAALALSYVSEGFSEFVDLARPFLEALAVETGESVTLAIEVDGRPVCVDVVDTTRPFKRQTAPGRIIGNLASVHGKIFAAFKPEEERAEMLAQPLPQLTPNTVTDPQALAAELHRIAREDLAFDDEGLYVSLCAVGSPVRDQLGEVVAAISVVSPVGRYGAEERRRCAEAVKHTATLLSTYLGWNPR